MVEVAEDCETRTTVTLNDRGDLEFDKVQDVQPGTSIGYECGHCSKPVTQQGRPIKDRAQLLSFLRKLAKGRR